MVNATTLTKTLLREETLIGTVLSHFHAVPEAQKLAKLTTEAHPIVSFAKKAEGQLTFGHEIAHDTLEHARIRVSPKDAEPQYRYFRRIHSVDGTVVKPGEGHGLSASAWVETDAMGQHLTTDGKCNLRVSYAGYTADVVKEGTPILTTGQGNWSAQTASMDASLRGEFPQAREVGPFLDKAMESAQAMGLPPVRNVVNTSWSMGAANALTSNLYFKHRAIPSAAILGDAWKASQAVPNIAMRSNILLPLMNNSRAELSRYSQSGLRKLLAEDVISVYPATRNQAGTWTRNSTTSPRSPDGWSRFPLMKWANVIPAGETVGQVVHLDAAGMDVLERLGTMGHTHHRTNIINHLASHNEEALHEITQLTSAKNAGRGVM